MNTAHQKKIFATSRKNQGRFRKLDAYDAIRGFSLAFCMTCRQTKQQKLYPKFGLPFFMDEYFRAWHRAP